MHATVMKKKQNALAPSKTKSQLAEEEKLDSMIAGIPDATGVKNCDVAARIVCQVGESLLFSSP
jgi:hypothetical protein